MPPLPLSTAPPPRASCHGRRLALKPLGYRRGLVRVRASTEQPPPPSRTQMIMDKISSAGDEVGGAGGAYSYDALKRLDQICASICSAPQEASSSKASPQIVTRVQGPAPPAAADLGAETFDVLVCGGTLGIFMATALSYRGLRVGIVERNAVKGREQEWNISRKELHLCSALARGVPVDGEGTIQQDVVSGFRGIAAIRSPTPGDRVR